MKNESQLAQSIIDDYDFVAVTERLDESLVVLQMLLDLPLGDILYLVPVILSKVWVCDPLFLCFVQAWFKSDEVSQ